MKFCNRLSIIDSHTAGEPTRMVVGGYPKIEGNTMAARKRYLEEKMDWLRRATMHEPRGHRDMFGCILMAPVDPDAHIGAIYMDGGRFYNMCGHASLGVCAMLVETGQVEITGRQTEVRIDTPAGVVVGTVQTDDAGEIEHVSLIDVPSFVFDLDVKLEVEGHGTVTADISYGGNIFVIAAAADLGIDSVGPENTNRLIGAGVALRSAANEQLSYEHPELSHINRIDIAMLTGPVSGPHADARNIVILGDAQADRSPCGTGTCARIAVEFARKRVAVGEMFRHESSIGTVFDAKVLETTKVGSFDAVIPQIACRPFITAFSDFVYDPQDPLRGGFTLGTAM
ncbi:proline racemase family protein [Leisingera sp. ANG-DT]|uniref:proline racemase family protein n=1 Tax=Leisingera sp. ANG-DT TaxID=1577897 RepID=UPI0005806905|nr:proline racemase family protein [Leisingera sp. ANG-DT]KIC15822.1 hypothetical protein RA21_14915 [Leisingera sp. ANG-DT]